MAEPSILRLYKQPSRPQDHRDPIEAIKARQTEEVVLAVCGYIGSGTSNVAKTLGEIFAQYNYEVEILKLSDIIRKIKGIPKINRKTYESVEKLQDAGNELRTMYKDNSYLAQCIIEKISLSRNKGKKPDDVHTPE